MNSPYDVSTDTLTIFGVKYAMEMFQSLALAEPGTWFRIENQKDGVVTVFTPSNAIQRALDAIAGRGLPSG